jgi:hypothetical protein
MTLTITSHVDHSFDIRFVKMLTDNVIVRPIP